MRKLILFCMSRHWETMLYRKVQGMNAGRSKAEERRRKGAMSEKGVRNVLNGWMICICTYF